VRLLFVLYAGGLGVLLGLVFGPGEALWAVTLFLFGPRWVIALPLPVLVFVALLVDRRLVVPSAVACLAMLVPLLGFNIPWGRLTPRGEQATPTIRALTWNLGGGVEPGPRPVAWVLEEAQPDVAVLQECDDARLEQSAEWHHHRAHETCLLSRFPIVEVAARDAKDMWKLGGSGEIVRYTLDTPVGTIELTNVHLETPREGLEAVLGSKLRGVPRLQATYAQRELEARAARRWVDEGSRNLRLVAGDFNTPVESNLFRTTWNGFRDCHAAAGWGFGHTKHTRRIGTRIDHILAGHGFECVDARVGPSVGGDHAPVIATLRRSAR
jgi:endonuclease/exonuclease/phosphatase (EEP) superfamily protein YafD